MFSVQSLRALQLRSTRTPQSFVAVPVSSCPPPTHTSPSHSTGHQIVPAAQCSPLPEYPPPTGAKERHRRGEEEVKVSGKGTATAEIPALSFVLTELQAADVPPSLRPWCRQLSPLSPRLVILTLQAGWGLAALPSRAGPTRNTECVTGLQAGHRPA